MNQLPKNNRKSEKGQSLTELSVGMIILMIMFAGIVDMGRLFLYYMALRDSAQEGAIYGSLHPGSCAEIEARARGIGASLAGDETMSIWIGNTQCPATPPADQACMGNEIRVEVNQPDFELTMPFIGTLLGKQTIPIRSEARDMILVPVCP